MRVIFWFGAMALFTQLFSFGLLAADKGEKKMDKNIDFYESVAAQKYVKRNSFPQARIPVRKLPPGPVFQYNGGAPFKPMEKIDSLDKVKKAIAELRKKYKPFMRNLAPPIKQPRRRLNITKMQFRYETPEDQADFNYTLSGKGKWQDVTIPYYHGPQGPATALYRAVVDVDEKMMAADIVMLHFNGADYYCDASINGHHIGSHEGMLDPFEFDTKPYLKLGKNIIVVKLRNDYSMLGSESHPRRWGNKIAASNSPGWDDPMHGWNCCIAGFGIYQDLYLETRSFASIADIFPRPLLKKDSVEVWVECDMPDGNRAGDFVLRTSIYGQNFEATVAEGVSKKIKLAGGRCLSKQIIKIPKEKLRLWTPDSPWLYQLQVSLCDKNGEKVLDAKARQFGMRSFVISTRSTPKGRMYLNGKEIRLRGTNTMGFLQKDAMAHDWDRLIDDLLMAKVTNMNFIRTTQRSLQAEVYDYADRLGMMMQSDLPLFGYINNKQFNTAIVQVGRMERLLRSHPSVILISYLNESMSNGSPISISRAEFENLFDAADIFVHHENPDRAVKYVDGDYQSPNKGYPDNHCYNIWYHRHGGNIRDICRGSWIWVKKGWMYGCGEFGGEGLDSVELMLKYYPPQWLPKDKNPDNPWTPALMKTAYKSSQTANMSWQWFEPQTKMADWVRESRKHQAWGLGLITKAFRRHPRMNSIAVHLFIDAWPNGWLKTIVDTDRVPKPAWYVYRDALTPLAIQVRTDKTAFSSGEKYNTEIWICNDTQEKPDAEIRYQVEKDGKVIETGHVDAKIPSVAEGCEFQGYLPITAPATDKRTTFVVRVGLFDKKTGAVIHEDAQTFDLYPKVPTPENKTMYVVGEFNADAKALAEGFGLKQTDSPDKNTVIIITDYGKYDAKRAEIDAAIKNGAKAIALCNLPNKGADIAGFKMKVTKTPTVWFVGRAKNHPVMKGTTSVDFKYLYSSDDKAARMHRIRIFEAKGLNPVLILKGNDVVAEKQIGKGRLVVYQLDLAGRLCNPAIKTMLYKLLFK